MIVCLCSDCLYYVSVPKFYAFQFNCQILTCIGLCVVHFDSSATCVSHIFAESLLAAIKGATRARFLNFSLKSLL